MKIGVVLFSGKEFGGMERRMVRVFNELARKNRVTLIARSATNSQMKTYLELAGCSAGNFEEVICVKQKTKIAENTSIIHVIARSQFDCCVFGDCSRFSNVATRISHLFGIKTLLIFAYGLYYYDAIQGKKDIRIENMIKAVDHIDLLYPDQAEFFAQSLSRRTSLTVTPNTFTDLNLFSPKTKKKQFVFIAARLEKDKNPQMVVEAANLCQSKLRECNYSIQICGQGYEEATLKGRIKALGLTDIIKMSGYTKTHTVLPEAQVLLAVGLTSNYPSQTIAEAAASGCGVIVTDVGETHRLLDDAYTFTIEPNAESLAGAMCLYIDTCDNEKRKLVESSRDYAVNNYSIDTVISYYEQIFETIQ
ncbi:MAG: glycosyltransferase [Raoultibacter sp.]